MLVTVPPELLVALHGKFAPAASRGLLSGVPYGGGVTMTMWALAAEAMRAIAEAERAALMEGIFLFCFLVWLSAILSVCFVSGCLCGVVILRIENRAMGMVFIASQQRGGLTKWV